MSGVEFIVSAVLASIPLAIEVYDHSERIFEVFSVFKRYPREVLKLDAKLCSQRTAFRNHAINLLTAITNDRGKVHEVLCQPSSPEAKAALKMSLLYQNRVDALEESFISCHKTIQQMSCCLQKICQEVETFRTSTDSVQQTVGGLERWRFFRQRLKLSLNKPQLEKALQELRDFNADFGLITSHITNALKVVITEEKGQPPLYRTTETLESLQRYQQIRTASTRLYSTLQVRWACMSHFSHVADVYVMNTASEMSEAAHTSFTSRNVSFRIVMTPGDAPASNQSQTNDPIWLEVDLCEEPCQAPTPFDKDGRKALQDLTEILNSSAKPLVLRPADKTSKSVKAGKQGAKQPLPSSSQITQQKQPQGQGSTSTAPCGDPDLATVQDFCAHFQKQQLHPKRRIFLGDLKESHLQRFYAPTLSTASCRPRSLSEIIDSIADEPLPRATLIGIAGTLANGIMQFYSTPWLHENGLGQSVKFFQVPTSPTAAVQLMGPHFMGKFDHRAKSYKGKNVGEPPATSSKHIKPSDSSSNVRNNLLFQLGILLLEIGFGKPWTVLKADILKALGDGHSDYAIAEKLAQRLVREMGLTYPKVVRKCLGCDFGLGETDLDDEELQCKFLDDVVLALRQLEEKMRDGPCSIKAS